MIFARTMVMTAVLAARCLAGWCLAVLAATDTLAAITVNIVVPLSGSMVTDGATSETGMQLAVDAINARGGLLGQYLNLVVIDDGCDPEEAEAAADRAVADHPKLVVGHYCSEASLRAAPIYARANILQISPTATNPRLTELGIRTVFRMIGRDDRQGMTAVDRIASRWATGRIAVLDDGSVYARGLADTVRHGLTDRNVPIILNGGFAPNAAAYSDMVRALADNRIEVLYLSGYSLDIGLLLREIGAAGLHIQVLGGDSLYPGDLVQTAGAAAEGLMFTMGPDVLHGPAATPALVAARTRHETMTMTALQTYAAVEAWAEAVRRARSFEPTPVAAALRGSPIPTVIGMVGFDEKGDILGPAGSWLWYRWHDGRAELESR
ncbi:MAG: branched-chain amino acid ABC transporter substrate-binding protein [Azospirillaceae bacterium]|nr:branched-chain amino acid ABC transporter substrate-binding protein [Azospirillaceae bacterium]